MINKLIVMGSRDPVVLTPGEIELAMDSIACPSEDLLWLTEAAEATRPLTQRDAHDSAIQIMEQNDMPIAKRRWTKEGSTCQTKGYRCHVIPDQEQIGMWYYLIDDTKRVDGYGVARSTSHFPSQEAAEAAVDLLFSSAKLAV
jgi:hypothetical protein